MFMEWVPVVVGLLCVIGFGYDCSVDVRGSNAIESIMAALGGCFNAPSHYSAGFIEDRV